MLAKVGVCRIFGDFCIAFLSKNYRLQPQKKEQLQKGIITRKHARCQGMSDITTGLSKFFKTKNPPRKQRLLLLSSFELHLRIFVLSSQAQFDYNICFSFNFFLAFAFCFRCKLFVNANRDVLLLGSASQRKNRIHCRLRISQGKLFFSFRNIN